MNFIHQEREEVIKSNNIAQTQIVDILKNIDSVNTIDLNVNMPLSGDLDLSVLSFSSKNKEICSCSSYFHVSIDTIFITSTF